MPRMFVHTLRIVWLMLSTPSTGCFSVCPCEISGAWDEGSSGLFVASDVALGRMLSSHHEFTFGTAGQKDVVVARIGDAA